MTQSDFHSAFRNLLHDPLPPAPDPRRIAFELFRRDQRRTHTLAVMSLLFWVLGTAGILLLVFALNRLVMDAQFHSYVTPHSARVAPGPGDADSMDQFIHINLPPIAFTKIFTVVEVSVVALLIAALLTVALVFSSRQATLNRINLSLMQISEQLMQSHAPPPGEGPPAGGAMPFYSLPPAGGWSASSMLIKLLLGLVLLLLVAMPALWVGARFTAAREAERNAVIERDMLHRPPHRQPHDAGSERPEYRPGSGPAGRGTDR